MPQGAGDSLPIPARMPVGEAFLYEPIDADLDAMRKGRPRALIASCALMAFRKTALIDPKLRHFDEGRLVAR